MNKSSVSSSRFSNKFYYFLLAIALLGLADATYLTVSHYTGGSVECSITHGCEQVLTSEYATIYGVPLALLGALYYATLFLLAYYYQIFGDRRLLALIRGIALAGLATSAYLVYLQFAVINAICQYCMISAGLTTIIAVSVLASWLRQRQKIETNENI